MYEWLNTHISLETLFWLFPIMFLLHDFEEILFVELWFKKNYSKASKKVPKFFIKTFQNMSKVTAAQFTLPVVFQFLIYIISTYLTVEYQYYNMFLGFNLFLLLHVFMHIGQSLLLGVYTLGLSTAVTITLPYSIYLFYRLLDEGIVEITMIAASLPYGVITIVIVLLGHKLAHKLIPS
ncbi:HXXEE domain-containing protein [Metabacillus halosaccharovorans]|uniref:HXXEE domain-containing protein n=1 Tax=Metabacillus halosaccharovorans TaxID=930124 RepID=UPI001C1FA189|nr:HXXEE domain-containing protein [Metabacillus halosaccharovorans]MBU7592443.1 HXXEE domain-containing protein [Metabacillus halosaccharovorans]